MKEKVVLAYSGGLDTTAIIPWLKETFNYDVICCCIDCGQGEELDGLEERAKLSGAAKLYIEDIVDDFADNYIVPCVQAHAVYEDEYLLGTSMARPAIAYAKWPTYDIEKTKENTYEMVVQVNGKVRGKIEVYSDISKEEMEKLAMNIPNVQAFTDNKEIVKVIVVPKKLVNIVVK